MINGLMGVLRNPSRLSKIPDFVRANMAEWKHRRNIKANYAQFIKSGQEAINGDLPYDMEAVHRQFADSGYPPADYFVDVEGFRAYCMRHKTVYESYKRALGDHFPEKALEHYVSLTFLKRDGDIRVLDIANGGSPFPQIVNEEFGGDVWSNDLNFKKGTYRNDWHIKIGSDACELPVDDDFFDLAVLHCAIEMFEGDADIRLIKEAERILKPGGRLVIVPLYMNETYHILRDPVTWKSPLPVPDKGARLIYRDNFHGVAFARFYSVEAFMNRLKNNAEKFILTVYRIRNLPDIGDRCYLNWIAVFEKREK